MVEKAGDIEAKVNLQPPYYIREIDFRCLKDHYLLVKKDKNDTNWEHHNKASNKDKEKAKTYKPSSANQPQTQVSKKRQQSQQGGYLATGINAIEVAKKDKNKDKVKDLSHVEYYTYKQKRHYANKCLKKPKNQWRSWRLPCQWLIRKQRKNWNKYLVFGILLFSRIRLRPYWT